MNILKLHTLENFLHMPDPADTATPDVNTTSTGSNTETGTHDNNDDTENTYESDNRDDDQPTYTSRDPNEVQIGPDDVRNDIENGGGHSYDPNFDYQNYESDNRDDPASGGGAGDGEPTITDRITDWVKDKWDEGVEWATPGADGEGAITNVINLIVDKAQAVYEFTADGKDGKNILDHGIEFATAGDDGLNAGDNILTALANQLPKGDFAEYDANGDVIPGSVDASDLFTQVGKDMLVGATEVITNGLIPSILTGNPQYALRELGQAIGVNALLKPFGLSIEDIEERVEGWGNAAQDRVEEELTTALGLDPDALDPEKLQAQAETFVADRAQAIVEENIGMTFEEAEAQARVEVDAVVDKIESRAEVAKDQVTENARAAYNNLRGTDAEPLEEGASVTGTAAVTTETLENGNTVQETPLGTIERTPEGSIAAYTTPNGTQLGPDAVRYSTNENGERVTETPVGVVVEPAASDDAQAPNGEAITQEVTVTITQNETSWLDYFTPNNDGPIDWTTGYENNESPALALAGSDALELLEVLAPEEYTNLMAEIETQYNEYFALQDSSLSLATDAYLSVQSSDVVLKNDGFDSVEDYIAAHIGPATDIVELYKDVDPANLTPMQLAQKNTAEAIVEADANGLASGTSIDRVQQFLIEPFEQANVDLYTSVSADARAEYEGLSPAESWDQILETAGLSRTEFDAKIDDIMNDNAGDLVQSAVELDALFNDIENAQPAGVSLSEYPASVVNLMDATGKLAKLDTLAVGLEQNTMRVVRFSEAIYGYTNDENLPDPNIAIRENAIEGVISIVNTMNSALDNNIPIGNPGDGIIANGNLNDFLETYGYEVEADGSLSGGSVDGLAQDEVNLVFSAVSLYNASTREGATTTEIQARAEQFVTEAEAFQNAHPTVDNETLTVEPNDPTPEPVVDGTPPSETPTTPVVDDTPPSEAPTTPVTEEEPTEAPTAQPTVDPVYANLETLYEASQHRLTVARESGDPQELYGALLSSRETNQALSDYHQTQSYSGDEDWFDKNAGAVAYHNAELENLDVPEPASNTDASYAALPTDTQDFASNDVADSAIPDSVTNIFRPESQGAIMSFDDVMANAQFSAEVNAEALETSTLAVSRPFDSVNGEVYSDSGVSSAVIVNNPTLQENEVVTPTQQLDLA